MRVRRDIGLVFFILLLVLGFALTASAETMPMNRLFSQDTTIELQLDSVPGSISISGAIQGQGTIKVYALDQDTRKLVFDKSSIQIPEDAEEDDLLDLQIFTSACIETCSHTFSSNNIQLEIEVQDAFLYIEDLSYTIAQAPAQEPGQQAEQQPVQSLPVETEPVPEPEEELVDIIVQLKEKEPLPSLDVSQFESLNAEEKEQLIGQIIKIRRAKIKKNQEEFLSETNEEEVGFQYDTVNAVAMTVKKSELNKIRNNPDVALVEADIPLFASIQTSVPLINADKLWNISIDGSGRSICVIDSGIDYTHPAWGSCTQQQFLAGNCAKVPFGYDFYNNDSDPMDDYYHGTHVAGISALSSSAYGVAPGAKIIAMKSLSNTGSGSTSQVLAGIDACIANASLYNISAITMSLGNNQVYSDPTPCDQASIGLAISTATAAGIFVAVASGNNAGTTGVSYPACVSNATSIGSTVDTGWGTVDSISTFTNRGALLDLLAPGERINSTRNNNLWHTGAGTSQATPHVSGAAALLQHYSLKNNNILLTPHEIREILKRTGKTVFDSATNLTFPRIDIEAAANSLLSISGTTIQKTGRGKITYPSATDITNAQYCVNISQNKVEINSSDNYCTNFNTFANITLNSVGFTKTPVILEDGSLCPSSICSLINWDGNDIVFNVQHFSAFSTAVNGNLTTYSSDDYPAVYEYVDFYANYTNYTLNPITNANCIIEFSDAVGQAAMNYNSGLYTYRRLFTSNGSVSWTVNCTSNYEPYKITSTVYVLESNNTNDTDSDGVPDTVDSLVGSAENVSSIGVDQVNVMINGSTDIDGKVFEGELPVKINDNGNTLCNFTFNFSKSKFNLSKVSIKKDWYYTICSLGSQLQNGQGKTLFLTDNGYTSLCVKDAPGIEITNISDTCDQANEVDFTSCIGNSAGVTISGLTCVDLGSSIEITNLSHSGVKGTGGSPSSGSTTSTSYGSGGGGGGGGGGVMLATPAKIQIENTCLGDETIFTVFNKAGNLASLLDMQIAHPITNELIASGKTDKQGRFIYKFAEKGLYKLIAGRTMPLRIQFRIIDCDALQPVRAKKVIDYKENIDEIELTTQEYSAEKIDQEQEKQTKEQEDDKKRLPKNRIYILGVLFALPIAIAMYFVIRTRKSKRKTRKRRSYSKYL